MEPLFRPVHISIPAAGSGLEATIFRRLFKP